MYEDPEDKEREREKQRRLERMLEAMMDGTGLTAQVARDEYLERFGPKTAQHNNNNRPHAKPDQTNKKNKSQHDYRTARSNAIQGPSQSNTNNLKAHVAITFAVLGILAVATGIPNVQLMGWLLLVVALLASLGALLSRKGTKKASLFALLLTLAGIGLAVFVNGRDVLELWNQVTAGG